MLEEHVHGNVVLGYGPIADTSAESLASMAAAIMLSDMRRALDATRPKSLALKRQ